MQQVMIAGISGGIGHALARRLLGRDSQVRIWGLCRDPASVVFDAGLAERVTLVSWDALEQDGQMLSERFSGVLPEDLELDTLFYTAGMLHGEGLVAEKRLEDVQGQALIHAYQVNAVAFLLLTRALQPWLRHRSLKRILAVSAKVGSISDNGLGGWYGYRASKAALNMFVRNLAIEWSRRARPVACVAVHPGTTRTRLSAPFGQSLQKLKVHEPEATADHLIAIAEDLAAEDNGRFINWDGSDLPW